MNLSIHINIGGRPHKPQWKWSFSWRRIKYIEFMTPRCFAIVTWTNLDENPRVENLNDQ